MATSKHCGSHNEPSSNHDQSDFFIDQGARSQLCITVKQCFNCGLVNTPLFAALIVVYVSLHHRKALINHYISRQGNCSKHLCSLCLVRFRVIAVTPDLMPVNGALTVYVLVSTYFQTPSKCITKW